MPWPLYWFSAPLLAATLPSMKTTPATVRTFVDASHESCPIGFAAGPTRQV